MGSAGAVVTGLLVPVVTGCSGGPSCGPGTQLVGDECVSLAPDGASPPADAAAPGAHYEIRTQSLIVADGHTEVPVLVLGTNPDGTAIHGDVVLDITRAGAGAYTDALVTLGDLGATSSFVPCNSETTGCVGSLGLTMALASDPATPVDTVETMLGPPAEIGSVTACLGGGNVMHFDGNDYIYNGVLTVDEATWGAEGDDQRVQITVIPDQPTTQGAGWYLTFQTRQMTVDLQPSVYQMAQRAGFEDDGRPGMDVSGDGRGCSVLGGAFQIHEYTEMFGFVDRLTASFEQRCENSTTTLLTGCVHYERNP